jgi:hypothetical protein
VTTGSTVVLTAVADAGAPPDCSSSTCEFTSAAADPAASTPPIDNNIATRALGAFIRPASSTDDGTGRSSALRTGDIQETSNNFPDSAKGHRRAEASSTMRG